MKQLEAELSQGELAERMGRKEQWIGGVESGERRVIVVEFYESAEAMHFRYPLSYSSDLRDEDK
jgi:transcriptional regulator with XRE-family HTH domain